MVDVGRLVFLTRKNLIVINLIVIWFLIRFKDETFTFDYKDYEPTTFDNFDLEYTLEGDSTTKTLRLFDTAGQEDFKHMRQVSYKNVDVLLIGFSIVDRVSFEAVTVGKESWNNERKTYMKDAKVKQDKSLDN